MPGCAWDGVSDDGVSWGSRRVYAVELIRYYSARSFSCFSTSLERAMWGLLLSHMLAKSVVHWAAEDPVEWDAPNHVVVLRRLSQPQVRQSQPKTDQGGDWRQWCASMMPVAGRSSRIGGHSAPRRLKLLCNPDGRSSFAVSARLQSSHTARIMLVGELPA